MVFPELLMTQTISTISAHISTDITQMTLWNEAKAIILPG
jgi:hypothetical protein